MMKKKVGFLVIVAKLIISSNTIAQSGMLDPDFGIHGTVFTDFENPDDGGNALSIQPDGKIISAGYTWDSKTSKFALTRHNPDGSIDVSFGLNGKVTTPIGNFDDEVKAVAIQQDGKIIVAGYSDNYGNLDFALVRYNQDGSIDNTFGTNGIVITDISEYDYPRSLLLQSDGKIIVAGISLYSNTSADFTLIRFNKDGSLDDTFGTRGLASTALSDQSDLVQKILLQPDDKIVAIGSMFNTTVGQAFALVRYNSNGTIDKTFGADGKIIDYCPNTIHNILLSGALQSDGKIITAGWVNNHPTNFNPAYYDIVVSRYNTDGSNDNTFGEKGKVITDIGANDQCLALALHKNGDIVAGGISLSENAKVFTLIGYHSNGSLDSTFGTQGKVITNLRHKEDVLRSIAIQPDEKIVAIGNSTDDAGRDMALVRYQYKSFTGIDELIDSNIHVVIYPNPIHENATLQYTLNQSQVISVHLYDELGKKLKTFVDCEKQAIGKHSLPIALPDNISKGSYIMVVWVANHMVTVKVMIP